MQDTLVDEWGYNYVIGLQDVGGSSTEPKEDVEVKSRDIGPMVSTPSKRKSKKKSEASTTQTASTDTQVRSTNEAASPFTPKFILGVALVSIIIGIILGKRY